MNNNDYNLNNQPIIFNAFNLKIEISKNVKPEHENVFWHGGTVAEIKTSEGKYIIYARGIVSCDLVLRANNELLVSVKDKNEDGLFAKKMSCYIKDDKELNGVLTDKHKLYKLIIYNNNWFELSFYDKKNEIIYDVILDSDNVSGAVSETLSLIQEDNEKIPPYAIYCRINNTNNFFSEIIGNQIKKCLLAINNNVEDNTEIIKIYIDNCSGLENQKKTLKSLLADIQNNKIRDVYTVNISRLSRNLKTLNVINKILENSNSDIYLVDNGEFLKRDLLNQMFIPINQKKDISEEIIDCNMEEIEYE